MKIRRVLGAAAVAALAGIAPIAGVGSASAAEVADRVIGPLVVTDVSDPGPFTAVAAWQYTSDNLYLDGKFGQDNGPLTNMQHPNWSLQAKWAFDVSLPAPGAGPGAFMLEEGTGKGRCIATSRGANVDERPLRGEPCSSDNQRWRLVPKGAGLVLVWEEMGRQWALNEGRLTGVPSGGVSMDGSIDMFNPTLFSPVSRTVADPTAHVVGAVVGGVAAIAGTGEPGATITVTGPDGTKHTTTVGPTGTWGPLDVPGFTEDGKTYTVDVKQTIDGLPAGQTTVDVTTPPAPAPIVAAADSATVEQGETVEIDVLANDSGHGKLTISGLTPAAHGDVVIVGDKIRYTADADYQGADSFTYEVTDELGRTVTAIVSVSVAAKVEIPLVAPAFALGGLVLAGAAGGARALRRRSPDA